LRDGKESGIPVAAYSALTASSKLQHLDLSSSHLPAGALVWPHVFPIGRQLPHSRELNLSYVHKSEEMLALDTGHLALKGSRLVSCCPGLQNLSLMGFQYSAELLATLQGLSGLHTLACAASDETGEAVTVEAVRTIDELCQLTRLRCLKLRAPGVTRELLLQLTHLQNLTELSYAGTLSDGSFRHIIYTAKVDCWKLSTTQTGGCLARHSVIGWLQC
jgi:hypothetical protein